MEEAVKFLSDYALALIVERWIELVVFSVMLALWRWWMGHKLRQRISALERRASMPAINQTFNFNAGSDANDYDRQLQNAIGAGTVRGLRETIDRLPQHQLDGGHTYAKLPDGTNIVSMADGSIRLALPLRVSATFTGGLDGSLSAAVGHNRI